MATILIITSLVLNLVLVVVIWIMARCVRRRNVPDQIEKPRIINTHF